MLQYFVLIGSLCMLEANAFWWPTTTTAAPSTVLQQIPLTYFRTYTYQPLAGSPFNLPLFGFGAAQTPLLSSPRYDPYAMTSYAAARRHDAKADVTPPPTSSSTSASTPSTTTTTTTTTPEPTTTTSTTTTTSPAPPSSSSTELPRYGYGHPAGPEYPTYSRRVSNLYQVRPQYPYPDYFNYQPPPMADKSGARIQFVPCMCPVSVGSSSGLGLGLGSGSNSISGVSISQHAIQDVTESSPAISQSRQIADDGELSATSSPAAPSVGSTTAKAKLIIEAQLPETTPVIESNSLA